MAAALSQEDIQKLLREWQAGSQGALETLLPVLYEELKVLAKGKLRGERRDHTLQTTALVNEACLKLLGQSSGRVEDQRQFFAVASKAMRQVLIDHARRVRANKRISPEQKVAMDLLPLASVPATNTVSNLIELSVALDALSEIDGRAAQVVEMMVFSGLTAKEVAAILDVTPRTVERDWRAARLWLFDRLRAQS